MPDRPPELESAFAEAPSIEERIYHLLVGSTDALSATDVAEELSCSVDTSRKYLNWFAELGVATRRDGRPARYERNTEYFEWLYVSELADGHTLEELGANVLDIRERIETLRDCYDAEDPASVDLREAAERLDLDLEAVWDDLSTWAGLEDELRLHDRARRRKSERTGATAD